MTSRTYKIRGAISTVPNLMEALNQVRNYCNDIGCKYAAVFNGYQIVVFSPITIGKSWKEGHCVFFNSLSDIKENFNLFWNMLAFEHVTRGSLINYLEKGKRDISFFKLISEIHNPDQCWARNQLYTYIRPISDFVFSELLDEARTQVLKECYVFGKTNKPLIKEMQDYFTDKLPYFAEKYKIKELLQTETKAGSFEKEFLIKSYNKTKGSLIVLLGGIGSGKSTFLHRFFKLVLASHENLLWFYVDFRTAPIKDTEIESYILNKMLEEWIQKYLPKFTTLLGEVGFKIDTSDLKNFFSKLFNLLQHLKFSITISIDNVDQHDYNLQEKIFLTSYHLTDMLKAVTIVALREETFLTSTRTGIFDAYDTPKFHIASPDFLEMVLKRIDFSLKILTSNVNEILPNISRNEISDLKKYFSIIKASLYKVNKQSVKIISFIDNISVGNMREALKMFNNFIVSGNTNIKEIFERKAASGTYQIAYHQFIKSIILGEYRYYMQNRSHIMNVFDFDTSATDSHYNLLRILKYLLNRFNKRSLIGRGYVPIQELISAANEVFIKKEVIRDSLLRLSNFNLVEYDNQSKTDIDTAAFAKITTAGKYYLSELIYEFAYLDPLFIDTPISNLATQQSLRKLCDTTELGVRLERTRTFVDYLYQSEADELKEHPEYLHNEFTNNSFGKEIKKRFEILGGEIRRTAQ
ncbi:MAG: hypothetical protein ABSH06_29860 [Thermodesulfobacteriota bacterium]|jgi:energy-coupling factor transporter ATP-binding protein EcfA2